jgi:glyoxylase-like metal-dependent hydrolase (beta-lactamase superfamily II)
MKRNLPPLRIFTVLTQPFAENSYIVGLPDKDEVFVIDPGYQPELILDYIDENQLRVAAIVNTHGHCDHIAGNAELKQRFPDAPIVIGVGDAPMLTDADANFGAMFDLPAISPPADRLVTEGDFIEYAGVPLHVLDIPGHSPGHVVYLYHGSPKIVFGGDVLFRDSVGRTDFTFGSFEQLASGIRTKLWPLPDDSVVYPGHGPVTTIGRERRHNPFVGESARPRP